MLLPKIVIPWSLVTKVESWRPLIWLNQFDQIWPLTSVVIWPLTLGVIQPYKGYSRSIGMTYDDYWENWTHLVKFDLRPCGQLTFAPRVMLRHEGHSLFSKDDSFQLDQFSRIWHLITVFTWPLRSPLFEGDICQLCWGPDDSC